MAKFSIYEDLDGTPTLWESHASLEVAQGRMFAWINSLIDDGWLAEKVSPHQCKIKNWKDTNLGSVTIQIVEEG